MPTDPSKRNPHILLLPPNPKSPSNSNRYSRNCSEVWAESQIQEIDARENPHKLAYEGRGKGFIFRVGLGFRVQDLAFTVEFG